MLLSERSFWRWVSLFIHLVVEDAAQSFVKSRLTLLPGSCSDFKVLKVTINSLV
jgi:hypothetical protein